MVPDTNNVYGQLVALDGLRPVLRAVEATLGPGAASVYRSGYDRAETLRIRCDTAEFESIALPGGIEYLLNGAVGGSPEEVVLFLRRLSAALVEVRVEHSFEVYDPASGFRASVP